MSNAENRTIERGDWRAMRAADLPDIKRISYEVHRAYGEEEGVYAERLKLYPQGCLTLQQAGVIIGFLVAHPWHRGASPALNEKLGSIPTDDADYYLHDIALLAPARGQGHGEAALSRVIAHARQAGFEAVTLVAVNGAETYWASHGFKICDEIADGTGYGPGTYRMRLAIV